jgi:cytokinin trans-hydroxylase
MENTFMSRKEQKLIYASLLRSSVFLLISCIHFYQSIAPNKFDPSRFDQRQLDFFLPFSARSRACIGQNFVILEAKILLATIVRQFHLKLVPGQKYVPEVRITMK